MSHRFPGRIFREHLAQEPFACKKSASLSLELKRVLLLMMRSDWASLLLQCVLHGAQK